MRALAIDCEYTTDIREANLVIGGRNLGLVPEHFRGQVLGAGLDRKCVRTFPLMKVVFLLGHKTGECILSKEKDSKMLMGDPLFLADLVHTRLANKTLVNTNQGAVIVSTPEEQKLISDWKWIDGLRVFNLASMVENTGIMEILEEIGTKKFIITTEPEVYAVALSFNIPVAAASFHSGDAFCWKDLFSALPGAAAAPLIRRLKVDSDYRDWCKNLAVGDLKLLKAYLQRHFQFLKTGSLKIVTVPAPAPPPVVARVTKKQQQPSSSETKSATPPHKRRSRSLTPSTRKSTTPKLSTPPRTKSSAPTPEPPPLPDLPSLNSTGTFLPLQWASAAAPPPPSPVPPSPTSSTIVIKNKKKIITCDTPKVSENK